MATGWLGAAARSLLACFLFAGGALLLAESVRYGVTTPRPLDRLDDGSFDADQIRVGPWTDIVEFTELHPM